MKYSREEVKKILAEANRVVILTGAGISVASGIPDFRSPQGLYHKKRADGRSYEEMLSSPFFFSHPAEFYEFYWEGMVHEEARPTPAHLAIAHYAETRDVALITQNIDGLDAMAGTKRVYELHGTTAKYHCLGCGKKFSLSELPHHGVPVCDACGSTIKPDVVLYGESLPEEAFFSAMNAIEKAEAMIVAGTSLRVEPFASLTRLFHGRLCVLVNMESTPYDDMFDATFFEDLQTCLPELLHE